MDRSNLHSVLILGRQPALGLAELERLYGASVLSVMSEQVAGLTLPAADINFNRLGGSTRLAEIIDIVPSKLWKDVEKALAKQIVRIAADLPEGKLQLGLSAYGISITPAKLNASALTLKKIVRGKSGRSVRITPNPELELNTAQVLHNHLTGPTGIELLMIATGDGETIIARTIAVQDIDSYTLRDRGRPKRDARVGMLPPKLAQIIINLAVADADPKLGGVVLDPFCGTGVLLIEASRMGFDIYGSDLEQRMADYTDANLQWSLTLSDNNITALSDDKRFYTLEVGDATTKQWHPIPNYVAAETYLGRPFTERPTGEMVAKTASEVNLILKKFLKNIHSQLASGSRLCLAVPAWQIAPDRFKHLPLIDSLGDLGYNQIRFEHVSDTDLIYYRSDQVVARQLIVLTKQ